MAGTPTFSKQTVGKLETTVTPAGSTLDYTVATEVTAPQNRSVAQEQAHQVDINNAIKIAEDVTLLLAEKGFKPGKISILDITGGKTKVTVPVHIGQESEAAKLMHDVTQAYYKAVTEHRIAAASAQGELKAVGT